MIHAVMIIAHKNIYQVIRLIQSIQADELHVFVHLDKKMNLIDSDIDKIQQSGKNVFFISNDRISGSLDTWSLVEITLSMIRHAKQIEKERNVHYSYWLLLSGQDYPIKGTSYIIESLDKLYPKPLIDCTPYHKDNWVCRKFNFVVFPKINQYLNSKMGKGITRKFFKAPFVFASIVLTFIKTIWNKFFSYGYNLYGGSAWWILPDKVISFILDEVETYPEKIRRLKRTLTPEETFFQIMTMASPLGSKVDVNPVDWVEQNCMTYAHFSDSGKPFTGHPYILTAEDFQKLIAKPQLFARKFDTNFDSKVLDMLDEQNANKKQYYCN